MEHAHLLITLAIVFGFFMAWGIGANDVANAMGTSVGSKAITITQAIIIAAIFEAAGSLLAGGQVTDTIRSKIIDAALFSHTPEILVLGMLASLLAAGTWLVIATSYGWPVSTTHSIVGAVIGFGVVVLGPRAIYWHQTIDIALSWIVTPIMGGVFAFLLFRSVQRFIFNAKNPIAAAKRYVPCYAFLVAMVLAMVTCSSGLRHLHVNLTFGESTLASVIVSLFVAVLTRLGLRKFDSAASQEGGTDFNLLERIFTVLMVLTACAMAFSHGSNDVANAVGPLAAVIGIVKNGGAVLAKSSIPIWVMMLGAAGIVIGLATYGYKVIATVGTEITQLTPSRGFAAQLACASTVVMASGLGLPVSTTQTLVGAVLGVGFARGIAALNLSVIRNIFLSWVITLPAGALFAVIYYYILHLIFM